MPVTGGLWAPWLPKMGRERGRGIGAGLREGKRPEQQQ